MVLHPLRGGGGEEEWRYWGEGRGCVGGEWVPSWSLGSSSLNLLLWNGEESLQGPVRVPFILQCVWTPNRA